MTLVLICNYYVKIHTSSLLVLTSLPTTYIPNLEMFGIQIKNIMFPQKYIHKAV